MVITTRTMAITDQTVATNLNDDIVLMIHIIAIGIAMSPTVNQDGAMMNLSDIKKDWFQTSVTRKYLNYFLIIMFETN